MLSYFMVAADWKIERKHRAHKRAFDSCCHEMLSFVTVTVNKTTLTEKEDMRIQLASANFQWALICKQLNAVGYLHFLDWLSILILIIHIFRTINVSQMLQTCIKAMDTVPVSLIYAYINFLITAVFILSSLFPRYNKIFHAFLYYSKTRFKI